MPELPEVEMRRRYVQAHALGQRVDGVSVLAPELLNGVSARTLQRSLVGHCFETARRHGKWLFVGTDQDCWLILHFGMTGNLWHYRAHDEAPRFVRLCIAFAGGGCLAFTDPRKFGEIGLTDDVDAFLAARRWGPDPTLPGFDLDTFRALLHRRKGLLKGLLLNQQAIAGIGNLYADEMLFQTGLHPETQVQTLKRATIDALYAAMMAAFEASLTVGTDYDQLPDHFLLRHRNSSRQCPKCRGALASLSCAGRTTYYCPRHQRKRS